MYYITSHMKKVVLSTCKFYAQKMSGSLHITLAQLWKRRRVVGACLKQWSSLGAAGSQMDSAFYLESSSHP